MARFYIATTISRWKEHNLVRDLLTAHGHKITYDWTNNPDGGNLRGKSLKLQAQVGADEMRGVAEADFGVVLLPGGFGTHAEIGALYITSTPTFIHASDPAFFSNDMETGKVRNFYLGAYMHRFLHPELETASLQILHWWEQLETQVNRPPAYLAHLTQLEACGDCPVGGRWDEQTGEHEATCPRVALCDWEAAHTSY
jgi:hypothetical protein